MKWRRKNRKEKCNSFHNGPNIPIITFDKNSLINTSIKRQTEG
jgi:hypothetical protein